MNEQGSSEDGVEINRVRARGASTPGVVRYVLGASLALIVVVFAILLIVFR
jgi:hypothetical protein